MRATYNTIGICKVCSTRSHLSVPIERREIHVAPYCYGENDRLCHVGDYVAFVPGFRNTDPFEWAFLQRLAESPTPFLVVATLTHYSPSEACVMVPKIIADHDKMHQTFYVDGPEDIWRRGDGIYSRDEIGMISDRNQYLGGSAIWLPAATLVIGAAKQKSREPDGCFCTVCKQFSAQSAPNQPDNTFKCWICRENPLRAFV